MRYLISILIGLFFGHIAQEYQNHKELILANIKLNNVLEERKKWLGTTSYNVWFSEVFKTNLSDGKVGYVPFVFVGGAIHDNRVYISEFDSVKQGNDYLEIMRFKQTGGPAFVPKQKGVDIEAWISYVSRGEAVRRYYLRYKNNDSLSFQKPVLDFHYEVFE